MTIDKENKRLTKSSRHADRLYYQPTGNISYSSIISRFVNRIKQTFQYLNLEGSRSLSVRAQTIIPRIDVLLDQLKSIDAASGDHELYSKYIALPLIREGSKLREEISNSSEPIRHQLISQYILWGDRSYRWVDRFFRLDSANLNKIVIDEIINEARARVEKDLHLVTDYIKQQMDNLDLSDENIDDIRKTIQNQLEPVIDAMKLIEYTNPQTRSSADVRKWKENLHMLRQKFFDQCLEIVDNVIELKTPKKKSLEKKGHLIRVLESIHSLESAISELKQHEKSVTSELAKKHLKRKIAAHYQQAHKISLDIRLSEELFDRVQKLMSVLADFYDELS